MNDNQNEVSVLIKTYGEEANKSLQALVSTLGKINTKINKLNTALNKTSTSSNKAKNSIKSTSDVLKQMSSMSNTISKSFNKMFDAGKLYLFWNVTKRIRDAMVGLIESSVDYIETQNLFDTSMQGNSDRAYKFMNTMANTFGLARTELMNYQASFNNVMKSLPGLGDETAYVLSETLMKMSIDYASLFNFTLPKAMEKFQAALVGSVKPIRDKTGLDITEKTIQGVAKNIGVEKTVGQLNQVEKRLLRIIALQDQLGEIGAIGDFSYTLEQPANQLKVLQQQLQELGVWLGNVFIGTIGKILPYINGFVMALVAMAKALAIFVGYKETKTNKDPLQIEDTTNSVDDLSSGLGGATARAKELKKVLMGFDVLNVITTPTESSGGGGAGTDLDIDPAILNALKEYDNQMEKIRMKAIDIRDRLLEWLGFTWDLDEEGNIINLRLGDGYTNLEKIRDALIAMGVIIAGFKILKKIIQLVTFIKELKIAISSISKALASLGGTKVFAGISKALAGLSSTVLIVVAAVAALIAVFVDAYKNDEKFKKSVDDLVETFNKLISTIKQQIQPIVEKLLPKIQKYINSIGKILTPILNVIKEIIKLNLRVQIESLGTILEVLIKLLEGDLSGALDSVKQGLSDVFTAWMDYFDSMKTNLSEWIESGKEAWSGFFKYLTDKAKESPLFNTIITKFTETFESVKTTISNKVAEIKDKMQPIVDKVVEIKDKIAEIFTALWNWANKEIKEEFVDPAIQKFQYLKDKVSEKFQEIKSAIEEKLRPIVTWIDINVIQKVTNLFNNLKTGISRSFSGLLDNVIYNISIKINNLIDLVNKVIRKTNSVTGSNIQELEKVYTGHSHGGRGAFFADGGFPDVGQMFIAREAGPELVGSIGNRTAVVNNQQIVESVSRGVAQAVSQVMGTQGGSYNFYLDSEQMTAVVTRKQNRQLSVMGV